MSFRYRPARVILVLAALLGAAVLMTVIAKRAALPEAARLILRRGNGPEPESLDPHRARSEAALTILRDLYEGLTEISADGSPVLAAADTVDISPDGKTYRFHIRDNARWSNGEPLVAEDFAAAWRRLVDPHTGGQYADLLAPVLGASSIVRGISPVDSLGVHVVDSRTLQVELERPTPYFLSLLAHPATFPLNRPALAAHGRGFSKPGVMVSNGAFVLTRWDFGSHLVAERNHRYWNDAATRLDGVEYYAIPEPAAELRAFRSGELDVTSTIPSAQYPWIKQTLGAQLRVTPQLAVYYLGLNLRKEPFANSRPLRQAMAMVIDRERLVQSVTATGESPAYSWVPPQTLNYTPSRPAYAGWPMAQRIAKARELLASSGVRSPPTIELRYNSGELHARIALAVAAMWKDALGIETILHAEEFKVLLQDIDHGDALVYRASWLADYDDAYSFLQVLQSGFGINLPHYSNPEYDDLLARAADEPDAGRRRDLLQRGEGVMIADQPLIPLFFYVAKHLVSARVDGWEDNAMNVVYSKRLAKAAE